MADPSLYDLEVPLWPIEAHPFEPVHGLFARFAERNGQTSSAVFANHVGINWSHPNLSELLTFCSKYPVRQWERTIAATPTLEGKRLIINAQSINPHTDWSIYQPRVCEGCLHEAAYYRNWWDITAIHHCPIHDRPLVSRENGARLGLWYSRVGVTPDGTNLAKFAPRVGVSGHAWEQYVLGRMGVVETTLATLLDDIDLDHVIEATELLGTAVLGAIRDKVRQRPAGLSYERAAILSAGAPIALSGLDAVSDCIYKYVETRQRALKLAGKPASHPSIFRGRLAKLAMQSGNPLFLVIRREMDKAIDDLKIYARRVKGSAPLATRPSHVPLKQLASQLGIAKHQLRRLAVKLDLVAKERTHGAYIALSGNDAALLKKVHKRLVGRNEAVSGAGLSGGDFDRLCKIVGVIPFVRYGLGRPGDQFCESDLEMLMQRLPDYVQASGVQEQEGADGECAKHKLARTFQTRAISKRPGLSYSDVATTLGVSPTAIKPLLEAGYLSLVIAAGSFRARVDVESVDAFRGKYAAAH